MEDLRIQALIEHSRAADTEAHARALEIAAARAQEADELRRTLWYAVDRAENAAWEAGAVAA